MEPLICVNDGSGTLKKPRSGSNTAMGAWIHPWALYVPETVSPEPYNVKYWEIGNEVWGQWQVGTCTAEQFAKRTISFAKAMKEADASIVFAGLRALRAGMEQGRAGSGRRVYGLLDGAYISRLRPLRHEPGYAGRGTL